MNGIEKALGKINVTALLASEKARATESLGNAVSHLKKKGMMLTQEEKPVFEAVKREHPHGLLHLMMSGKERRIAESLVEQGVLKKGNADLLRKPVAYFLNEIE